MKLTKIIIKRVFKIVVFAKIKKIKKIQKNVLTFVLKKAIF